MAEDPITTISAPVVERRCPTERTHPRHRYLGQFGTGDFDLMSDSLIIYECPGVSEDADKFLRPIEVTLTAEEVFVLTCAMEHEYSEADQHGPHWERICREIELPRTDLTYAEVTRAEGG